VKPQSQTNLCGAVTHTFCVDEEEKKRREGCRKVSGRFYCAKLVKHVVGGSLNVLEESSKHSEDALILIEVEYYAGVIGGSYRRVLVKMNGLNRQNLGGWKLVR
jgi:hypothetical protein